LVSSIIEILYRIHIGEHSGSYLNQHSVYQV